MKQLLRFAAVSMVAVLFALLAACGKQEAAKAKKAAEKVAAEAKAKAEAAAKEAGGQGRRQGGRGASRWRPRPTSTAIRW